MRRPVLYYSLALPMVVLLPVCLVVVALGFFLEASGRLLYNVGDVLTSLARRWRSWR